MTTSIDLPAGSLAFSYCQVPVVYRLGDVPGIELERADGRVEHVDGDRLDMAQSLALFERRGAYRRVTVTVLRRSLYA